MNCPKCKNADSVKAGFNNSKQRYKCKPCGCHFTRSTPKGEPVEKKRQALQLYLEGLGFRAIARFLKVSHVTVQAWIAQTAEGLESLVPLYPARAELIELDEMHHYVGKKTMFSGYGLLLRIGDAGHLPRKWVAVARRPQ
jgi:transposase-like protein